MSSAKFILNVSATLSRDLLKPVQRTPKPQLHWSEISISKLKISAHSLVFFFLQLGTHKNKEFYYYNFVILLNDSRNSIIPMFLPQALVHVSTAYSNCDKTEVDEVVYPPRFEPSKIVEAAE